ncbi:thermonuclease family protein [Corticicoccus populi]|uniref:Thermonuclease n=1 Tax=Corticicoccus populi TaxID=1812821 RepID=A0ABW5WT13_9STAP
MGWIMIPIIFVSALVLLFCAAAALSFVWKDQRKEAQNLWGAVLFTGTVTAVLLLIYNGFRETGELSIAFFIMWLIVSIIMISAVIYAVIHRVMKKESGRLRRPILVSFGIGFVFFILMIVTVPDTPESTEDNTASAEVESSGSEAEEETMEESETQDDIEQAEKEADEREAAEKEAKEKEEEEKRQQEEQAEKEAAEKEKKAAEEKAAKEKEEKEQAEKEAKKKEEKEKAEREKKEQEEKEKAEKEAKEKAEQEKKEQEEKEKAEKEAKEKAEQEKKEKEAKNGLIPVTLYRVVDGDTVNVYDENGSELKLRLLLIDTPETVHPNKPVEPYGREASARMTELVNSAEQLYIEYDQGAKTDHYDRHLVYLYADDVNVHQVLLEEGLARVGYVYEQQRYLSDFRESEQYAKDNQLGIWSIPGYVNTAGEGFNSEEEEPEPSQPAQNETSTSEGENYNFANCTELRQVFPNGVASDHPAYQPKMDRDKDNWACER